MRRTLFDWFSPELNRKMEVARFGEAGRPVVLFPTAGGDYLECERFRLIEVCAPLIEAGRVRIYTCGSISGEGWLDSKAPPWHKSWLQSRFDQYLVSGLVPFIRGDVGDPEARLVGVGASLGAYNAVNAACRHPDLFSLTIAMSGTYDFDRWMSGYRDDNYVQNQPFYYLPNLSSGPTLDWLRRSRIHLASGQGRWEAPWESVRLGQMLGARGIPNYVDLWGKDVDHDWPTWRTMLPMFLDRLV